MLLDMELPLKSVICCVVGVLQDMLSQRIMCGRWLVGKTSVTWHVLKHP